MKRKKGYFSISAVAKMFSVHQQTIRLYEKEGLIAPKRSEGNTRLFAEEDVDRLEEVIYLTHKLGINLAGVEMILRLQKQIKKIQKEMNLLFKNAQNELVRESDLSKDIIKSAANRLAEIKKDTRVTPLIEGPKRKKSSSRQQKYIDAGEIKQIETQILDNKNKSE